jgi:hypothetical protein
MSQEQQALTGTLIADLLAPFAEAVSIRLRDASGTLRKRIIASLHFARVEQVHNRIFPSETLDWPAARAYLEEADTTTAAEWVRLISLLHFGAEPPVPPEFAKKLMAVSLGMMRPMADSSSLTPIDTMRLCFARGGLATVKWDLLCKTLVLVNLSNIDAPAALQQLMAECGTAPTVADAVLKHMPAICRHDMDAYTDVFAQLLSHQACQVAAHVVLHSIRCREKIQEAKRQSAQAALRSTQKPSLTRLLQEQKSPSLSDAATQDTSFKRFCWQMRLPGDMHPSLKAGAYYIALLPLASPQERNSALHALLEPLPLPTLDTTTTTTNIALAPLREFIQKHMEHVGTPCPALQQFRREVLQTSHNDAPSWTMVLRLYLAAYAPSPLLQQELWWEYGNEAQRDAFVRTHPPAVQELVRLIRANQPHGSAA